MIVNFGNEKGINGNVFYNCVLSVIVKLFFQENLLFFSHQTLDRLLIDIAKSNIKNDFLVQ